MFMEYSNIMIDRLKIRILEFAQEQIMGQRVFYILKRAAIKITAEISKMQTVCDVSSSEGNSVPSLNNFIHNSRYLQWISLDVLISNRLKVASLLGDIKQAFLPIEKGKKNPDTLRLHCIKDTTSMKIITVRVKSLPFDCALSPFMLKGTLETRFGYFKEKESNTVADDIKRTLQVIDLIPPRNGKVETRKLR